MNQVHFINCLQWMFLKRGISIEIKYVWTVTCMYRPMLHRFEIVVCFTGSSRATGQISEERTSYLPREILWGHRFKEIVEYDCEEGVYLADYDRFDEIEIIDTPLCSAMEWDNIIRQYKSENDKVSFISQIRIVLYQLAFFFK